MVVGEIAVEELSAALEKLDDTEDAKLDEEAELESDVGVGGALEGIEDDGFG